MNEIMQKLRKLFTEFYLHLILFISLSGIMGSLLLSEIELKSPCELCWWQRAFLYPIFPLALLAIVNKEAQVINKYLLSLAVPGILFAIYHIFLQAGAVPSSVCSPDNPCAEVQFQLFGFLSIPMMSFAAFFVIILSILGRMYLQNQKK